MLNSYDEIALSVVKNLNSRKLNMSLGMLAENDVAILPPNDYVPKIWENKWYNDESLGGYSKGDIVWKWTMDESAFIINYASLIQKYASNNARLCSYFDDISVINNYPWDNENAATDKQKKERQKYVNVISGYSETVKYIDKTSEDLAYKYKYIRVYPMLFDYCYDYDHDKYDPNRSPENKGNRVEIYISLVDDNKSFLSDTASWKSICIRTNGELSSYISSQVSTMFDIHVRDYHLGGASTYEEFDSMLLAKNLSNFNINDAYSILKVKDHKQYVNGQGVDYVVKFGKTATQTSLIPDVGGSTSTNTYLYKWYRLWNSGYLEHGGIVELPVHTITHNASDYEIEVNLGWQIPGENDVSAPVYDYDGETSSFYGNSFDMLYFAKHGAQTIERDNDCKYHLGHKYRYSISLTPVTVTMSDISAHSIGSTTVKKYKPFDEISSIAYPTFQNDDKNSTWINYEIHDQQNERFKIVRCRTSNLNDTKYARYIQYYTTGYMAHPLRDYSLTACIVKNLNESYEYTGSLVEVEIEVWTNDEYLLEEGVHYRIDYHGDHTNVGEFFFDVAGIYPYRGTLHLSSYIKKFLSLSKHRVIGIEPKYLYGAV